MILLGIETSCDDTSAAVFDTTTGIKATKTQSQNAVHAPYGGVVPELASRAHIENIQTVITETLKESDVALKELSGIAVTCKPGLPGSLLVGVSYAKALSGSLQIPIIGVNHLEGHIYSPLLEHAVPFPHICVLVSGGNTILYWVENAEKFTLITQTRDDAAGEAFDKIAKILGLPYPGGPHIERQAQLVNNKDIFKYPRTHITDGSLSFSGLKTAVLYHLIEQKAYNPQIKKFLRSDDTQFIAAVASSLQCAITSILLQAVQTTLEQFPEARAITLVGGVACNNYLRSQLTQLLLPLNIPLITPSPRYCTDNGAMIALVGARYFTSKATSELTFDIL